MSGAGPSIHTPDFPSWSVFQFPPDPAPPPITNPCVGEPTFANPFHIPQHIYERALSYRVPLAIASGYALVVTFVNWYNRQHGNTPWRIAKTRPFFAFVILHNVFLAVYSAVTCVAMLQTLQRSLPHYSEPNAVVGTVDALCKIHGPRGLGDAVTYHPGANAWASKNPNVLLADTALPDPTDVGRIWNEGLAFWGWWFYLSKFYEVLDTAIILAKGKRSTTLQKYHHAGAMLSMWAGMRFMSPPIWMFVLVNSGIHAMMYTYYTASALGFRVPNAVKRTLTTLQITQFLVGSTYAAMHLFVSYTVPVSIAHQVTEKVLSVVEISSIAQAVSSATSSAEAALPTATGAAVAFLRKLIYRAAGDEGLAENIAIPGQPLPYNQQQQQQQNLASDHRPEHPIEHFFHQTVNRVVYRNEYQSVPCIDTSGQAFAIYLNLIYLAPLTGLFMRFFIKSYLRSRSPPTKGKPKRSSFSEATRDASEEVKRELQALDLAAEDGISSAVNRSKDAVRGRKIHANGIAKDERHGSISPANKKFVDNVNRKVSQRLAEITQSAEKTSQKLAEAGKEAASKATESAKQVKETVEQKVEGVTESEDETDTKDKTGADGKTEANGETRHETQSSSDAAEASPEETQTDSEVKHVPSDPTTNSSQTANKKEKKSKLPQKKKERKETEESGVLVKKEDAADEDVQAAEKEPEPKDVNNTLDDSEGKGLF